MSRKPLVAANWKMNGSTAANAAWIESFLPRVGSLKCDVVVCSPAIYVPQLAAAFKGTVVGFGGEDVSEYDHGAYTGETAASMLVDIGAGWVLTGHSERRTYFGDTDARVAAKTKAAVEKGLKPIVCIGETLAEREAGKTIEVVERQVKAVMDAVGVKALLQGVLAYEPVWAIGTGKTATPAQAQEVHAAIRAFIAKTDPEVAAELRILYGGSVKPANAAELFSQPDIDGGLIGGAALKTDDFYKICAAA